MGLAAYGAAEQPASQEAKKAPKAAKKEAPPKKAPEYTKDEVRGAHTMNENEKKRLYTEKRREEGTIICMMGEEAGTSDVCR